MTRTSIAIGVLVLCAAAVIGSVDLAAQNSAVAALNAYRPPTPVIDVNEAAKKPFVVWTKLEFEPTEGEPGRTGKAVYMESEDFFVPAGQVLVIEYVNAVTCYSPNGEHMSLGLKTGYGEGKNPANLKLVVTEQGVFDEPEEGAYMHAGVSQQMKTYIRSGEAFRFTAWRSGGPTDAEAEVWIAGYLAPMR